MPRRHLKNIPKARQAQLHAQFRWLPGIVQDRELEQASMLWVSVFDHWLSREEANALLENIPADEASRRNKLLQGFCAEMIASTEVLSIALRGHGKHRPTFRAFTSTDMLLKYCAPGGGTVFPYPTRHGFRHRHFRVALPQFGCTFHESWDYTYHFYCRSPQLEVAAREWAARSGVYVLTAP